MLGYETFWSYFKLQNILLSTFFLTHSGTYNAMQNYLFTEKEKRLIFKFKWLGQWKTFLPPCLIPSFLTTIFKLGMGVFIDIVSLSRNIYNQNILLSSCRFLHFTNPSCPMVYVYLFKYIWMGSNSFTLIFELDLYK